MLSCDPKRRVILQNDSLWEVSKGYILKGEGKWKLVLTAKITTSGHPTASPWSGPLDHFSLLLLDLLQLHPGSLFPPPGSVFCWKEL